MSRRYDCTEPAQRGEGIAEAVAAVRRGELIVLPTDTVYGIGCDAFTPSAVTALLDAKGRGREMPPPVLVGTVRAASALIEDLGTYGQDLIDEFWPGALTLVCRANRNLVWDLGETKGTVAVRMPLQEHALELLKETGPLAVSSANLSGQPAARTVDEAEKQLGEAVEVYLDGGPSGHGEASTIVDLTGQVPRLLRAGAISEDKIRAVVGVLLTPEDEDEETGETGTTDTASEISLSKDTPADKPVTSLDKPAAADKPAASPDQPAPPSNSSDQLAASASTSDQPAASAGVSDQPAASANSSDQPAASASASDRSAASASSSDQSAASAGASDQPAASAKPATEAREKTD